MGGRRLFLKVSEKCVVCAFLLLLSSSNNLIFVSSFECLGNLFIAGTSCKDFSMLKSSHRKGKTTKAL